MRICAGHRSPALAAEGCISQNSQIIPQGAKAHSSLGCFEAWLKPSPFKTIQMLLPCHRTWGIAVTRLGSVDPKKGTCWGFDVQDFAQLKRIPLISD